MSTIYATFDTTTNKDLLKSGSIRKIFDDTLRDAKLFSAPMYNDLKTKDEYERDQRMGGLGSPVEIAEGENIPVLTPTLGTSKTYTQRQFGGGFRMSFKMDFFNKYNLFNRWAGDLAVRMKEAKDIELAVLWNNLTSTSLTCSTGFDSSYPLASASHTGLVTAGNYSNYLNAALSTSALESARYYFATLEDDNGNLVTATPDTLYYQPTLWPTVREILGSDLRPHELSNTINVFPEMGLKPYEYPRITATTAWGILAKNNKNYDVNMFTALEPKIFIKDAPDNTLDKIAIAIQLFTYGWGSSRLVYVGRI